MAKSEVGKIDGTAYGAFKVLSDGAWHSDNELERKCGKEGKKRARELRKARFGKFVVQVRSRVEMLLRTRGNPIDPGMTFYKIDRRDIRRKTAAAAALRERRPFAYVDDVDKRFRLDLSAAEILLLRAFMAGDSQLDHPRVKPLADAMRARLDMEFTRRLPSSLRHPFDLFEDATLDENEG